MEPRKIFKSGKGSFILTLPKDWVLKNGLKDGDFLYLDIQSDRIVVFPRETGKKVAKVDLGDLSFEKVIRRIVAYYLANYDILKLKVNTDEQRRAIAYASEMLIGMEIMEDTGDEIELMAHLDHSKINLEEMAERIGKVCLSMLSDFLKLSENFDKRIGSSVAFREGEVDRLCFLILRIAGESRFHRSFARNIERIADHVEAMTEALLKLGKAYSELSIGNAVYGVLKRATIAFLKSDCALAEEVLDEISTLKKEILKLQEKLTEYSKEEIIGLKTIFDSMTRILAYSSNIADSVVDESVVYFHTKTIE